MFEPLRRHAPAAGPEWPALAELQQALDARRPRVCNAAGRPLRVVPPGPRPATPEARYEARVYLEGALQVRPRSWHDYFNVLAWLAFPRLKAALNARHYGALREQVAAGRANRGPVQDALTLLDEGGVIVAADDAALLACIREFRWKALFWDYRARFDAHVRVLVVGHALHEKALQPFIGVTGRAVLLDVEPGLLAAPPDEQLAELDARAAGHVLDPERLGRTRDLAVLPILGVPGWFAETHQAAFYDNADYFRPGRRRGDLEPGA